MAPRECNQPIRLAAVQITRMAIVMRFEDMANRPDRGEAIFERAIGCCQVPCAAPRWTATACQCRPASRANRGGCCGCKDVLYSTPAEIKCRVRT